MPKSGHHFPKSEKVWHFATLRPASDYGNHPLPIGDTLRSLWSDWCRCQGLGCLRVRDIKVKSSPPDVARASRPLCRGHPARRRRAFHVLLASSFPIKRLGFILARERDAPATAGGTPALRPMDTAITFMSRTRCLRVYHAGVGPFAGRIGLNSY